MSKIKGRDTSIELAFRKSLRELGYRNYRILNKLKGRPDVVFPKAKIAIFIDGCFWHKCPKCYKQPKSNLEYWIEKINNNTERDKSVNKELKKQGYKVFRVWEHELKKDEQKIYKKFETIYKRSAKND